MQDHLLYYIYGLNTMFYAMAVLWLYHHRPRAAHALASAALLAVLSLECVKDLPLILGGFALSEYTTRLITLADLLVEPLYALLLITLCQPWRRRPWRTLLLHEIPFVAFFAVYALTASHIVFYIGIAWCGVYGLYYFGWAFYAIHRYHLWLRDNYSYTENIDLRWLRAVLGAMTLILVLWVVSTYVFTVELESVHLLVGLTMWMFATYCLTRHHAALCELEAEASEEGEDKAESDEASLSARVERLFREQRIYLTPTLRLADVAKMIGTNRTYMSRHFNAELGMTFFDYVNDYRLRHACELLTTTDSPLYVIAEQSGFNSLTTFRRQFQSKYGKSPTDYRGGVGANG